MQLIHHTTQPKTVNVHELKPGDTFENLARTQEYVLVGIDTNLQHHLDTKSVVLAVALDGITEWVAVTYSTSKSAQVYPTGRIEISH